MTPERGDLVLVRFVFSDERGAKRRPVLILSTSAYHAGRHEVIIAAVTSNIERVLIGDHVIAQWQTAGLPKPSAVTAILRTIKRGMIEKRLGALAGEDLTDYEAGLRPAMGL